MSNKRKISMKAASVLLCAAVVSTSVPFVSVFAAETEPQTSIVSADDSKDTSLSLNFAEIGTVSVICNGAEDTVEFAEESTVEAFILEILKRCGLSDDTEGLRLDWVDKAGFRTRILTGNDVAKADDAKVDTDNGEAEPEGVEAETGNPEAETSNSEAEPDNDTSESIQTVAELYALAKAHPDGLMLVGFDKDSEIARFTVMPDDAEDTLAVNLKEDSPELYQVCYDANGGVLGDTVTVLRAKGEAISYIESSATYEDHAFAGWYDAKEGGNEVTESTLVESDMNVYAHWMDTPDTDNTNTDNANTDNTSDNTNPGTADSTDTTDTGNTDTSTESTDTTNTGTENGDAADTPDKTDAESDDASQTLQKYKLTVVSPSGTTTEVSVNENVALSTVAERLGYNAASFSLKTDIASERTIAATITMKEIADIAENGNVYIIGYDSDGNGLGSATVKKTADNTYHVSVSKDTNVGADTLSGKGAGEETGKGVGESPVENTGKSAGIAEAVSTGDTSVLPIYGVMTGLLAVLLGTLAMWKRKILQ